MSDLNKNIEQIAKEAFNEQLPIPPANIKKSLNKSIFGGSTYWLIGGISLVLIAGVLFGAFMKDKFVPKSTQLTQVDSMEENLLETRNSDFSYHRSTKLEHVSRNVDVQINESQKLNSSPLVQNRTSEINHGIKKSNQNTSNRNSQDLILEANPTENLDKKSILLLKSLLEKDEQEILAKKGWIQEVEQITIDEADQDVVDKAELTNNKGAQVILTDEAGKVFKSKKSNQGSFVPEKDLNQENVELTTLKITPLTQNRSLKLIELLFQEDKYRLKPRWELNAGLGIGTIAHFFNNPTSSTSIFSAPSYEFGINTRVFLKDWHVSTGLNMQLNQFKESNLTTTITQVQTGTTMQIDTIFPNPQDTMGNVEYDTTFVPVYSESISEENQTVLHKLVTVSIPLKFGYRFRMNKFHLMIGAGVQLNIPISANTKMLSGDTYQFAYSDVKTSPFNSVNAQLLLETEFHYRFNDKWSVSLRPSYRYQLSPVFKSDALFKGNKHAGFLNLGVHYYF